MVTANDVTGRLRNFEVRVGDFREEIELDRNALCGVYRGSVGAGATATITCTKTMTGRYVVIQIVGRSEYLTLCEVSVNGFLQANGRLALDSQLERLTLASSQMHTPVTCTHQSLVHTSHLYTPVTCTHQSHVHTSHMYTLVTCTH